MTAQTLQATFIKAHSVTAKKPELSCELSTVSLSEFRELYFFLFTCKMLDKKTDPTLTSVQQVCSWSQWLISLA